MERCALAPRSFGVSLVVHSLLEFIQGPLELVKLHMSTCSGVLGVLFEEEHSSPVLLYIRLMAIVGK